MVAATISPRARSARPRSRSRAGSAAAGGAESLVVARGEGVAATAVGAGAEPVVTHPLARAMGSTRTTRRVVPFIKPSEIIGSIVPEDHKEVKLRVRVGGGSRAPSELESRPHDRGRDSSALAR